MSHPSTSRVAPRDTRLTRLTRHATRARIVAPRFALAYVIERARDSADVRAAAAVRALAFASYDTTTRSPFAIRAHLGIKIDCESRALARKLSGGGVEDGGEEGWGDVAVACVVARAPLANGDFPIGFDIRALDPSLLVSRPGEEMSVVIASLDVCVGEKLPSEELVGASVGRRAYVANVSVVPPARRNGVALAMISRALAIGTEFGVETMYAHVTKSNVAARALYAEAGFEEEAREPNAVEATLGREPRLLLRRRVG